MDVVRRIVHNFYYKQKYPLTLDILTVYQKKIEYKSSGTSMWRISKSKLKIPKITGVSS